MDKQTFSLDEARVTAAGSLVQEALALLQKSQGTQKTVSRLSARLKQQLKACETDWSNDDSSSFRTSMQKNYEDILAKV